MALSITADEFESVLFGLSIKLEKHFPGWRFRIGHERKLEHGHTVILVQYSKLRLFERMSHDPTVEVFTYEVDPGSGTFDKLHDKIIARLMLLGLNDD